MTYVNMRQGMRRHDTRPTDVPAETTFYLMPTTADWTEDVRGYYCEAFWLPVIGPSALVIARRLAGYGETSDAADNGQVTVETGSFAHSFGLVPNRFHDTVLRLVDFELLRRNPINNRVGYAMAWPLVPVERQNRWPDWLDGLHEQWLADASASEQVA